MNLLKISIKNIFNKPLNTILSLMLFALGIGLISFLLLLNKQVQDKFDKNLAGIDLVMGAKGSPLQLILCSMYHIDAPTGNIKLKEVQPFLNPNHPLFSEAVPLSLGDSYQSYRIVGTNASFLNLYNTKIAKGKIFEQALEVVIGVQVADALHLTVGDTFKSNHGLQNDGMDHHHDQDFKVVGVLEASGSVADQLLLTSTESIWAVHETEHDHENETKEEHAEHENDKSITALLVKYRSRTNFQALNLPRNINENTNMQAASPAIEIQRLYSMMDFGEKTLRLLALVIIVVSGISIFIALFNGLRERKYELSLMRVMGASKLQLFFLILAEAFLLAIFGALIGLLFSHILMQWLGQYLQTSYRYTFDAWKLLKEEGFLFLAALFIGLIAGIIPAIMAYKTDIAKALKG